LLEVIAKSDLEKRLLALCEIHIGPLGFRVIDVDCSTGGRSLVRAFVEFLAPEGPRSPTLDECASVSRVLGGVLEAEELVSGSYNLEVSSPGLDRRLRTLEDFESSVGSEVRLRLVSPVSGLGKEPAGTVKSVKGSPGGEGDPSVVLQCQSREWEIPLARVRRANRVWKS